MTTITNDAYARLAELSRETQRPGSGERLAAGDAALRDGLRVLAEDELGGLGAELRQAVDREVLHCGHHFR